jgi:hypothetical protein
MSQLELALDSREMISRLADSLGVPLRERNALLVAGGFAPQYGEAALDTPELAVMSARSAPSSITRSRTRRSS